MRPIALAVLLSFVASACGGAGSPAAARPVFLTTTLTDVRTGAPFTIGGFPGKVVLVIAMAVT